MQKNLNLKKYLPQFVYGSIDGTVTTFAVVAGVAGASLSPVIILILGFANVFADGFSMAASNYLSERSKDEMHNKHSKLGALKTSFATFMAFVLVGIVPITPYIFSLQKISNFEYSTFKISCIFTALTFLVIGIVRGQVTGENKIHSAIETVLIGGAAATISYLVGFFLKGIV